MKAWKLIHGVLLRVLKLRLQYYMLPQFCYKFSIYETDEVPTNTRFVILQKNVISLLCADDNDC